jgi:peroxiredoxin
MADKLNLGDQFPELTLQLGDSTIALPQLKESGCSIVLFYRGHW